MNEYAEAFDYFKRQLEKSRGNYETAIKRGDQAGALGCKRKIGMYEAAVEAIKKSMPKKLLMLDETTLVLPIRPNYEVLRCASCGESFYCTDDYRPKYCWECGQAIDWEDGE